MEVYARGDLIYDADDPANDLYFTLKGTVMLPSKSMDVYRKVRTQSNRQLDRQLDSHPALPPNQTSSWTLTQPSHAIKPPAGLTVNPHSPTPRRGCPPRGLRSRVKTVC